MNDPAYWFGTWGPAPAAPDDVRRAVAAARRAAEALGAVPTDTLIRVLAGVGARFESPASPYRARYLEAAPAVSGFSREMHELELQGLVMALSEPYLEAKLKGELGRLDALDVPAKGPTGLFTRAVSKGVVLHVASGNVGTAGVLSLVEGLLTRNGNVLKPASKATLLPRLFVEALQEADPEGEIAPHFAVLPWAGAKQPFHEVFQQEADAVVVWGSEDTVRTYRHGLGLGCTLVEYGPKISCALLDAAALADLDAAAAALARDVAVFDQSACASAQVAYVETADPAPFVAALARALDAQAAALPMGALGLHERAEITKDRELAEAAVFFEGGSLHLPARRGPEWTIVQTPDPKLEASPLNRTIRVKPVPSLDVALEAVRPYRPYLQTAGLAVAPERQGALAEALFGLGFMRVTRLGEMTGGHPGEPHDGRYGLAALVRWVSLDVPDGAERYDGTGFLSPEATRRIAMAKRDRLVEGRARQAPYYRRAWPEGAPFEALPLLAKAQLLAETPPGGTGLFTREPVEGHWLRSGGSTGDPKLSIYTYEDYEADMARAARGAFAAGLRPGDKVANVFFAGDLYGSFLSINRTLELLRCNSFPFTQAAPVENVVAALKLFGIDTVAGLSNNVQAVLSAAAAEGLTVRRAFYAGEPFPQAERDRWREALGLETVRSIGYGAVDAGPMGYQCAFCTGDTHHLHDDHVWLEILDPDTGVPVPEGVTGEIVVTNLNRKLMPLVRYRIGDLARWEEGPCPCGAPGRRFTLLGRAESLLRIGAVRLDAGAIAGLLTAFAELRHTPQLHLSPAAELTIRVELAAGTAIPDALQPALDAALAASVPALEALAWKTELRPAGGLERVGRTGKIVALLDERA